MSVITIGGKDILLGQTCQVDIPVAKLYTDADVHLPVHIAGTDSVCQCSCTW
ncbi:hypothetical protein [Pseudoalteromonas luteoviolacea]|uniref:hypothetical protein n=1 Tax=Pseudoalteromonas luteoviolacea TaxID=43657 RepID=UPI0031BB8D04